MDLGLKDKVLVVTGGASGIGAAITKVCLEEGARVVVVGRMSGLASQFAAELTASGAACDFFSAELAEVDQCERAIAFVQAKHGRIDGLVNNAGTNDSVGLQSGTPAKFTQSLRENLLHYYVLAHLAVPMLKQAKGSIVNISSKVALTGQGGTSAYAAAKGAQLALTREWAAELLPFSVRVNSVVPAEVWTPLYEDWVNTQPNPAELVRTICQQIPLGRRMTDAREIATVTAFLLSNLVSGHTTGQHLVVDGGYTHLDRALTGVIRS